MDENIFQRVKKTLDLRRYVMNPSWLRDCVEYYLSEHTNPKSPEVLEFVTTQWQLSDLREICNEVPCLPNNLANQKCTTLEGSFILQMEKLYDISESKYKQLDKIRNVSIVNLEITEGEKTQATWEPMKKRMLYLHLTDGVQNVLGIEYKPIRFLNDHLLPGYKLMICGPVICRRGVLMLEEKNVVEMGGEVASLLIPNAAENVLARALNLPENPDPYNDNEGEKKASADELFNDDFDIDVNEVDLIEGQRQEATTSRQNESNVPSTSRENRDSRTVVSEPSTSALNDKSESELFFDGIDDNIFEDLMENTPKTPIDSPKNTKTGTSETSRNATKDTDHPMIIEIDDFDDTSNDPIAWKNSAKPEVIRKKSESDPRASSNEKSMELPATAAISKISIDDDFSEVPVIAIDDDFSKVPASSTMNKTAAPKIAATSVKRTADVLTPPNSNSPAGKMHCPQTSGTAKSDKGNRKITDWMQKSESSKTANKSYETISDVLAANTTNTISRKTVKGRITKFDKLKKNGKFWQLYATITDDTGSIDAEFSPAILELMLGFSVAEFSRKKKLGKTNPEIENYLRQGFRSAEKKVSKHDGPLQIELAPGKKPKVVKMEGTN